MAEHCNERFEKFVQCIDAFIQSIQGKQSTFGKCFPSAQAECPEALALISEELSRTFKDYLKTHAMALTDELELKSLMEKLEGQRCLSSDWKFSGNPREDARKAMDEIMNEEFSKLQEMSDKSQCELDELESQLEIKHSEVRSLLEKTEEQVRMLEKIGDDCVRLVNSS